MVAELDDADKRNPTSVHYSMGRFDPVGGVAGDRCYNCANYRARPGPPRDVGSQVSAGAKRQMYRERRSPLSMSLTLRVVTSETRSPAP